MIDGTNQEGNIRIMCAASLLEEEARKANMEEEKLRLEIASLRKRNKWWAQPILGVLVGVVGIYLTFVQFETQQDRLITEQQEARKKREVDQWNRSQDQIRKDIDEILGFPHDQSQSVARVSFLLEDIKTDLDSYVGEKQRVSDLFPKYERSLTKRLVSLVKDDCDFSRNARDIVFANTVIARWDDYSDYLKEESDKLNYILYKYIAALQGLRDQNPGYFEDMKFDKSRNEYIVSRKYERQKDESILYDRFIRISEGFKMHLQAFGKENLSETARNFKENNLRGFQEALGNRSISEHILGE